MPLVAPNYWHIHGMMRPRVRSYELIRYIRTQVGGKPPTPPRSARMEISNHKLSKLYLDHKGELLRHVSLKFALERVQAEDIVQQAFAKYTAVARGQAIANPRAYLFKMASNQALDLLRRQQHSTHPCSHNGTDEDSADDNQLNDPARIHTARQALHTMQKAMRAMPEKRRHFLQLSRFEHMSNVDIAKHAGISEAAVRKHISRALLDIKHAMDNQPLEEY